MKVNHLKRREFISLLSGAVVASPLAARAQQAPMPMIGLLGTEAPDLYADRLRPFRQGLRESGYVEGRNVAIEYRWAEGHHDRFPSLLADLVSRKVAVIAAFAGTPPALDAARRSIDSLDGKSTPCGLPKITDTISGQTPTSGCASRGRKGCLQGDRQAGRHEPDASTRKAPGSLRKMQELYQSSLNLTR